MISTVVLCEEKKFMITSAVFIRYETDKNFDIDSPVDLKHSAINGLHCIFMYTISYYLANQE